ncbi:EF-P 5-aminopentanol modification-associated protein YfmF [Bacillus benzoevorans]|uniref:Putative Zn-dependent peptidase n=1 Tax=Bacillus benzoevorans TaxID=1456 RepID=A0A7X0LU61_9BACI|nr:pitrilysin family protein [Bacillus benzoevorans]MBB6444208.1 putative Zn-dependent peptidase [Bacillus benzoevorans]
MGVISEQIIDLKGLKLHIIPTEKYKTNTIVFKMKAPLDKEDVTKRALLANVLQSSSKTYPSTTLLRSYLDELYGATFYIDLAKKGDYHIISFTIEMANEKFLSHAEPLLQKAFAFLAEVITNPNADNSSFEQNTIENEKRSLKQRIQSVYDDKMKYSSFRLIQEMCKGEPYELYVHGIAEDVDSITGASLYEYYREAIDADELDLFVVGDVQSTEVENAVSGMFQFAERTAKKAARSAVSSISEEKEVIDKQDVKQGKLNIGFRTNVYYGDDDYYALQVFNGIYGGFSHSKLFINVREKASLAYYAASRLESHKGLMLVMSGIDNKNYEQAVNIIKEQMKAMTAGDFTDNEIQQTKAVIKNQLLETIDTSRGVVEILYHNIVSGAQISLDDWLGEMEKVTKEDIVKVAEKIQLDTIYFLTEGRQ